MGGEVGRARRSPRRVPTSPQVAIPTASSLTQANRDTRPGFEKGWEPLRKNRADTVNPLTEERTHMQDALYAEACAGQVGYHASLVTMATESETVTEWTKGSLFWRSSLNLQQVINGFDADSLSARWQGKKGR